MASDLQGHKEKTINRHNYNYLCNQHYPKLSFSSKNFIFTRLSIFVFCLREKSNYSAEPIIKIFLKYNNNLKTKPKTQQNTTNYYVTCNTFASIVVTIKKVNLFEGIQNELIDRNIPESSQIRQLSLSWKERRADKTEK